MEHLAVIGLRADATEELQASLRRPEALHLWNLMAEGSVRSARFTDTPGVILTIEAVDKAEAEAIVRNLPMVTGGAVETEVLSLRAFTGFEILFAPSQT